MKKCFLVALLFAIASPIAAQGPPPPLPDGPTPVYPTTWPKGVTVAGDKSIHWVDAVLGPVSYSAAEIERYGTLAIRDIVVNGYHGQTAQVQSCGQMEGASSSGTMTMTQRMGLFQRVRMRRSGSAGGCQ